MTDQEQAEPERPSQFWKAFGPGMLFAGAAVGVSHLVQSTRAGAVYGLAMLLFVLIANFVKYPAFRFGQQYAAATGENLLIAYRRQGRAALYLFILVTIATMWAACAAISLTTAALANATFNLSWSVMTTTLMVWGVIVGILVFGRFRALDLIIKALMAFLTVTTITATVLILPDVPFSGSGALWPEQFDRITILFLAALVGWMPAPLDTAVWQSLWTQAKARLTDHAPSVRESVTDYNIGFILTMLLAVCFVLMGAGVMHRSGISFADGAAQFAGQIISLYEATLGPWVAKMVGLAAMAVIFSTTLTAIDAWPRTLAGAAFIIQGGGRDLKDERASHAIRHPYYWIGMGIVLAGAWIVLMFMMNAFRSLIDVATTVSFLTAPIFAALNHRAMFGDHVSAARRPGPVLETWSAGGVLVMAAFAIFYLWIRFVG